MSNYHHKLKEITSKAISFTLKQFTCTYFTVYYETLPDFDQTSNLINTTIHHHHCTTKQNSSLASILRTPCNSQQNFCSAAKWQQFSMRKLRSVKLLTNYS